jgi:hypothetical protein
VGVSDARRRGRHRVCRVVAIGAVAAILATGAAACGSPRGQHGAGGAGRALAVELAADYTATWQQHRLRFSFVVDDSEANHTGYNGVETWRVTQPTIRPRRTVLRSGKSATSNTLRALSPVPRWLTGG